MTLTIDPLTLLGSLVTNVAGRTWNELVTDEQNAMAEEFFNRDGHRFMFVTAPRGGNKSSGVAALLLVSIGHRLLSGCQPVLRVRGGPRSGSHRH